MMFNVFHLISLPSFVGTPNTPEISGRFCIMSWTPRAASRDLSLADPALLKDVSKNRNLSTQNGEAL